MAKKDNLSTIAQVEKFSVPIDEEGKAILSVLAGLGGWVVAAVYCASMNMHNNDATEAQHQADLLRAGRAACWTTTAQQPTTICGSIAEVDNSGVMSDSTANKLRELEQNAAQYRRQTRESAALMLAFTIGGARFVRHSLGYYAREDTAS